MNLLLDTHCLLWWLDDDPSLSPNARAQIANPDNTVFLSAVVIWEIRIKEAIGKLTIPPELGSVLETQGFVDLPVTVEHVHEIAALPSIHGDPFDRMLVAQARIEGFTIATRDGSIPEYGIPILEA